EVPVRLLAIGADAPVMLNHVRTALTTSGRRRGLGPRRVPFVLRFDPQYQQTQYLRPTSLPTAADANVVVPMLRIALESPLLLKRASRRGGVKAETSATEASRRRYAASPAAHPSMRDLV